MFSSSVCKIIAYTALTKLYLLIEMCMSLCNTECLLMVIHNLNTKRDKNSTGDETANVNFLRRHHTRRGQRLRPLGVLPNLRLRFSMFADTMRVTNVCIIIMAALCNRGAIIFLPCSFFLSIFLSIFFSFLA